jgi:hypothetical protein
VKDTDDKKYSVQERRSVSRDRTLAAMFLKHSNPDRYSTLLADFKNQCGRGSDEYPKDLNSAYRLLVNYDIGEVKKVEGNQTPLFNGVHKRTVIPRTPGSTSNSTVTTGNNTVSTNPSTTANFSFFQVGAVLTQTIENSSSDNIPTEWILLDSQSTFSIFKNENLLTFRKQKII